MPVFGDVPSVSVNMMSCALTSGSSCTGYLSLTPLVIILEDRARQFSMSILRPSSGAKVERVSFLISCNISSGGFASAQPTSLGAALETPSSRRHTWPSSMRVRKIGEVGLLSH